MLLLKKKNVPPLYFCECAWCVLVVFHAPPPHPPQYHWGLEGSVADRGSLQNQTPSTHRAAASDASFSLAVSLLVLPSVFSHSLSLVFLFLFFLLCLLYAFGSLSVCLSLSLPLPLLLSLFQSFVHKAGIGLCCPWGGASVLLVLELLPISDRFVPGSPGKSTSCPNYDFN